ncbi:MAG: hypothetical protein GF317_05935 [Candidatus Lokiarchaeota archaeon]|nr:hypothetical protein [Candidatus Lokiarchaeota archaeon]
MSAVLQAAILKAGVMKSKGAAESKVDAFISLAMKTIDTLKWNESKRVEQTWLGEPLPGVPDESFIRDKVIPKLAALYKKAKTKGKESPEELSQKAYTSTEAFLGEIAEDTGTPSLTRKAGEGGAGAGEEEPTQAEIIKAKNLVAKWKKYGVGDFF